MTHNFRMNEAVGAKDEAEVAAMGIGPGDPVVPDAPFTVMNGTDNYLAKGWDDRVGCGSGNPPGAVTLPTEVGLQIVKMPELKKAIAAQLGKVVVIDVWADY